MIKNVKSFMAIIIVLIFSSCTSVPDVPVCVSLNMSSGFCVTTITNKKMEINDKSLFTDEDGNKYTWFDLYPQMIMLPIQSWKSIKKYIIKQCKKSNQCSSNIDSWDRNMTALELKNP